MQQPGGSQQHWAGFGHSWRPGFLPDKTYKSEELWPFFRIRIPGLEQPSVQEILERENIDKNDEVELLKRFGKNNCQSLRIDSGMMLFSSLF